jgi:hypothetical protein
MPWQDRNGATALTSLKVFRASNEACSVPNLWSKIDYVDCLCTGDARLQATPARLARAPACHPVVTHDALITLNVQHHDAFKCRWPQPWRPAIAVQLAVQTFHLLNK